MFTGIVQSQAEVIAIIRKNNAISLKIGLGNSLIEQLEIGASVATVSYTHLTLPTKRIV